jgi:anti-sigma factor RsiW
MKCDEVKAVLNAYVDKELSSVEMQTVDEHLLSCVDCNNDYRELTELRAVINSGKIRVSAPEYLKKRVSDGLKKDVEGTSSWFGILHTKLAYGIPALLFGLVIGGAAMQYLNAWQFRGNQLDAIVSAHIHSLMADHLTDIASSDTHAVKPWFHGRIDFSPPINDLTSHGYPLIGGRLEYMAGNSVAALVYRHRQHAINLFISPKVLRSDGVKSKTFSGYNVIHWNSADLSYWAVSDLNRSDLLHFRELLRGATSPTL